MPYMVGQYNANMGGVDLLDSMVGVYRVSVRNKKWWSGFYMWSLSVSAVNAWRLRMKVKGKKEPYLDFLRDLVCEMFAKHGSPSTRQLCPANSNMDLPWQKHHWPQHTPTDSKGNFRRLNCKYCYEVEKKAIFKCDRCKVILYYYIDLEILSLQNNVAKLPLMP